MVPGQNEGTNRLEGGKMSESESSVLRPGKGVGSASLPPRPSLTPKFRERISFIKTRKKEQSLQHKKIIVTGGRGPRRRDRDNIYFDTTPENDDIDALPW